MARPERERRAFVDYPQEACRGAGQTAYTIMTGTPPVHRKVAV